MDHHFPRKQPRQYWWLCLLSILQLAVASVLTNAGWYGFSLVCYLFLAVWTLSIFSLDQAKQRFANAEKYAVHAGKTNGHGDTRRDGFGSGLLVSFPSGPQSMAQSLQNASTTRGSIQHDPRERWINARFVCGSVVTSCLALLVGAVFFAFVPRIWIGKALFGEEASEFGKTTAGARRHVLTGFTEEVQLGDISQILESTETVLEIQMFDNETNARIDVEGHAFELGFDEPLFRGTVLAQYEDSRWSKLRWIGIREPVPVAPGPGVVRQKIRLQPIGTDILFAIHPVLACRVDHSIPDASTHFFTSELFRDSNISKTIPISYTVFSDKRRSNRVPPHAGLFKDIWDLGFDQYREWPSHLVRLRDLAREKSGLDDQTMESNEPSKIDIAERLEAYLQNPEEFSYSLNISIQDSSIDPVEDFLFNRKRGHCEYFASSLALMLRTVGIPSRLISGFKGGITNQFSGQFIVQQRHAHTWVEAFINNRWVVLDPTPAGRADSVEKMTTQLTASHDFIQMLSNWWSFYVVGISLDQQQMDLYLPLKDRAIDWWISAETQVKSLSGPSSVLLSPKRWFSVSGFFTVFVVLMIVSGLVWGWRRLLVPGTRLSSPFDILWRLAGRSLIRDHFPVRLRVDFYERFKKLLAAQGLVRARSQTQREFANVAQRDFSEILMSPELVDFPFELVERFYRVRFGAELLQGEEVRELNQLLTQFERSLSASTGSMEKT